MAKHKYPERSENYSFYSDLLWCSVPLTGMACYFYGMRPALLMLAGLLTAYLFDCALAPLHGEGYRSHEPSSECFAALIVLMMHRCWLRRLSAARDTIPSTRRLSAWRSRVFPGRNSCIFTPCPAPDCPS